MRGAQTHLLSNPVPPHSVDRAQPFVGSRQGDGTMPKFKMTTITLAAAASLAALSFSSVPAFARGGGGGGHGSGGSTHSSSVQSGGHYGGSYGPHRYDGFGYGTYTSYASNCYYLRRFGDLIKVCE